MIDLQECGFGSRKGFDEKKEGQRGLEKMKVGKGGEGGKVLTNRQIGLVGSDLE